MFSPYWFMLLNDIYSIYTIIYIFWQPLKIHVLWVAMVFVLNYFGSSCLLRQVPAWFICFLWYTHLLYMILWCCQMLAGSCLDIKTAFSGIGISTLQIRWSRDCLIFITGILILIRRHVCIEMAPRFLTCQMLSWDLLPMSDAWNICFCHSANLPIKFPSSMWSYPPYKNMFFW